MIKVQKIINLMEESRKLYSQRTIAIATYIGTPAVAGYLVQKNYQAFGQDIKGRNSLIIGIVSTLLMFIAIFSIPEHIIDKIPNFLIPLIYMGIIYLVVEKLQGDWLKSHKDNNGEFFSAWKAAGIGAIFLVILCVIGFAVAFILGDLFGTDFDAINYDHKMEQFVENENESLKVFNVIETAESAYLVREFDKNVDLWKNNKLIVIELQNIENLPNELVEQNEILLRYCNLRIQHNELIEKAVLENTEKYVTEIENIGMQINSVLKELN